MTVPRAEHRMLARAVFGWTPRLSSDPLGGMRLEEIDWDYTVETAEQVGSLALLGVALARNGTPRPPHVDQRCRQARIQGAIRALVAERVLGEIDDRFGSAGVEYMVLKGLPLAQELYGEPGLRPMDDLDILVRSRERERALAEMHHIGFRLPPGALSRRFYLSHHFHLLMIQPGGTGMPVELHWNTQPFFSTSMIPEDEFWQGRRTCRVGSVEVPVPGREEEYLYLIQHLSRHLLGWGAEVAEDPVAVFLDPVRRGRLTWLSDLHLLSSADPPLDRSRMIRLAERWFLDDETNSAQRVVAGVHGAAMAPDSAPPSSPPRRRVDPRAGHGWGSSIPWLARTSPALHFRPILALHLLAFAFPGSRLIRHRYGDRGARSVRFALYTLYHAAGVLLHAIWVGASYLLEVCLNPFRALRRSGPRRP